MRFNFLYRSRRVRPITSRVSVPHVLNLVITSAVIVWLVLHMRSTKGTTSFTVGSVRSLTYTKQHQIHVTVLTVRLGEDTS